MRGVAVGPEETSVGRGFGRITAGGSGLPARYIIHGLEDSVNQGSDRGRFRGDGGRRFSEAFFLGRQGSFSGFHSA